MLIYCLFAKTDLIKSVLLGDVDFNELEIVQSA